MRISWNWLCDYISTTLSVEEIGVILTQIGLEVEMIEKVQSIPGGLEGIFIGEVLDVVKHENADKLNVTKVNLGEAFGVQQIVCGAPNVAVGQKVVVATVGSILHPKNGNPFEIKAAKIRGVESHGMICAEDEIGIGNSHDGIIVLPQDAQIGIPASEYYHIDSDAAIEIGLTPNRMDAMSHKGVARDIHVALTARNIPHEYFPMGKVFKNISKGEKKKLSVEVSSENCSIYQASLLEDIQNMESPKWLKFRLEVIGERSINAVVDCSNFILHDLGQPTHCFDASQVKNHTLQVKELLQQEKFASLIDQEFELTAGDLVIADENKTLCLAGIVGGSNSSVSANTKSILLETAYFNPTKIRQTTTRIGFRSESASKFEKGIDPHGLDLANQKMLNMLGEITGATLNSDIVSICNQEFKPYSVPLTFDKLYQYAGFEIDKKQVHHILTALEIQVLSESSEALQLEVPHFKYDVTREEDVIEEIMRIVGFDEIPYPKFLRSTLSFKPHKTIFELEEQLANDLVGQGHFEIMTNSIASSKIYQSEHRVPLLNAMTSELDTMREDMISGFLEVASYNINRDQKDLKLFEFGNAYFKKEAYGQKRHLAILHSGQFEVGYWQNPKGVSSSFYSLMGTVNQIVNRFAKKLELKAIAHNSFEDALEIICNKKTVGIIGMISPKVAKAYGLKQKIYFAQLDIEPLFEIAQQIKISYKEISKFPPVKRDFALMIQENITLDQIEKICKTQLKEHLIDFYLFDVFKDPTWQNQKSYAIRLVLENKEKTFEDKEIDQLMLPLIQKLEKEIGATIRS